MLGDIDTPTLPFGFSDVHIAVTEVSEASCRLSETFYNDLCVQARFLRVTLASLCHLAFAMFLSCSSGCKKVVFGTVLSGRLKDSGEMNESVLGLFINTLPIRLDINHSALRDALCETHKRLSALLVHEHASLSLAQRCSQVPSLLPLFSALFNYRHHQLSEIVSLPGVEVLFGEGKTNYPVCMSVDDYNTGLEISAQVIAPVSAVCLCGYMEEALRSIVDGLQFRPRQPVETVTLVPQVERKLLLQTWNRSLEARQSCNYCIHQLFEARVEHQEELTALEFEGQTLSYKEINATANELAHYLIQIGVRPETKVSLCVERGPKMLIALLAILKSGGGYVPLDPAYSSQRLRNILNDALPLCLLADAKGQTSLGSIQNPIIDLDHHLSTNPNTHNPQPDKLELTHLHLAYIIYTSGSTGVPKGVMVEHKQITNLLTVTGEEFNFDENDKWCLCHSFSFDFSVWEIWGALYHGGQLTIVPQHIVHSPPSFYNWICESKLTVLNQTPSAFKALTQSDMDSRLAENLRYIIFGGEALDFLAVTKWIRDHAGPKVQLCNMYGITETTVHATIHRLHSLSHNNNSIGRPLTNTRIYLLDEQGKPVPLGARGEIYIGGAGVSRGYLNQPILTANRFLADPFSSTPNSRMYSTGDTASYLPDGNLIYVGRTDNQLKIRGYRIEPAEIEASLKEHAQVREAVVLPLGNGKNTSLVAYIIPEADAPLARELRTYLTHILPDYMMPAAFVCIPSLPLTSNGKLDYKALPPPDDRAIAHQIYEEPIGENEEILASIWSVLLGVEHVGRNDNFFELGGHSLLIVQMLAHLHQLKLNTNVRAVFDTPTLAALATTLEPYQSIPVPPNLINPACTKIVPDMLPLITLTQPDIDAIISQVPGGVSNIEDIYSLASLQNGILFHHLMDGKSDPYLFMKSVKFISKTTVDNYATALENVVQRHDILRTSFAWETLVEPAQVVWRQTPHVLNEAHKIGGGFVVSHQQNQRLLTSDFQFDLTQAPLVRLTVTEDIDGSWQGSLVLHHLIIDHTTLESLEAEIHAVSTGQSGSLAIPLQFRNLIAQTRLGTSTLEHTEFFKKMLADIDNPTLPFSLRNVHHDGTNVSEVGLQLSRTLNDNLRSQARQLKVSLASLFHLGFGKFLASTSAECESVVFGTVLSGRLQAGTKDVSALGLWINTLPLRLDINNVSVKDAVCDAHLRLSALLVHEHASLALAQQCSSVPISQPLFSALLNYRHNKIRPEVSFSGFETLVNEERTNYPLTLSVENNGDTLGLTAIVVAPITAGRICALMERALVSLVEALQRKPSQLLKFLPILPQSERVYLLHSFNQSKVIYRPSCRCIHELFEAQVECNGEASCLEFEGRTLSYADFNTRVNQLAHYLIQQGIRPETRIAICMERGMNMIVAVIAVLKAGGAYVPLDPIYSGQRLNHILNDVEPTCLIVDESGLTSLDTHHVPIIKLDPLPSGLPEYNPELKRLNLTSANPYLRDLYIRFNWQSKGSDGRTSTIDTTN